jgi:hypothetical protein
MEQEGFYCTVTSVPLRREEERAEGQVSSEADPGMMHSQAKDKGLAGSSEAGYRREGCFLEMS